MTGAVRFRSRPLTRGLIWLLALVWLAVTLLPIAFMLLTSLKSQQEMFSGSLWAWPEHFDWSHYLSVLQGGYAGYLRNSLLVVGASVLLIVAASTMAAYALARLRFRFNPALLGLIVAAMVVPLHVTLVPVYLMTRNLGLYDTLFALIGPYVATSLPVSIVILTEFMRQIPRELEEAAEIDGSGPFTIFRQIFLPLSGPGIATVAIYNGIHLWTEFIFAYVLTSSPGMRTLPLALWDYQGEFSSNIPAMLAVATLTSLPLLAAYAIGQERIVKGMMAGVLKG
jgi:raffinose/stachyose/melibiose transport system permease protein